MENTSNLYAKVNVSAPKNSEIEITGEIPTETVMAHYNEVLESLRSDFELPGFRKGNVPVDLFKQHVHEHSVFEDAAEAALQEAYPQIIDDHKIDVLGRPQVNITKLAIGNPVEFKIRVGVRPEVKLPDYKKIAKQVKTDTSPAVKDEEVQEVIDQLRKLRAAPSLEAVDGAEKTEAPLSELTDEFVKTLGDFKDVAEFTAKLRENLQHEKTIEARRAKREEIAAKLTDAAKMDIPQVLVEDEAQEMMSQLLNDLENAKLTLEEYLKRAKKTEEDLHKEQKAYIERQLKTRFVLEGIAEAEKFVPDEKRVRIETQLLKEKYPNLDPERIHNYVTGLLKNEQVLEFLENGAEAKAEEPKAETAG
jgi:FKBP-type peptidyl-prolyl cis-trans isomerase (trigger factor)